MSNSHWNKILRTIPGAGIALALSGASRAPAQLPTASVVDTAVELASFDTAWRRIKETYYDSLMRGLDWNAIRDELRPRVARAHSRADTRAAIAAMLERLGESHFAVLPSDLVPDSTGATTADQRRGDTGMELRLVNDEILVTRVDSGSPAHEAGVAPGWIVDQIDSLNTRAAVLSLARIEGDRERRIAGLRLVLRLGGALAGPPGAAVAVVARDGRGRTTRLLLTRRRAPGQVVSFGALAPMNARLDRYRAGGAGHCIGIIRFNVWMTPIAAAFEDAMMEFGDCTGIVLDLRGNVGGLAAMVMGLSGFFFDTTKALGTLRLRGSELRYVANPRVVTRDGRRVEPWSGPLAIVVDGLSASTTELFTGALQALGRARVFGTVTAGQALPSLLMRLPNGDGLLYAIADYIAPGGRRLEGAGVVPDESVAVTRAGLLAGVDAPLEAAMAWLGRGSRHPRSGW